jgi:transketolase
MRATREGYADALLELGKENSNVVVLDSDLSKSTGAYRFGQKFPDRFINCGVAEQSMMGTAAGLAICGKICFTGSFAVFATGRAFEQIRNTIAYSALEVKICPSHAGITVGPDGGSHQSVEDISLMRSLPNMKVIVPADYYEAKAAVKAAVNIAGPVYIRLGRPPVPDVNSADYKFALGQYPILRKGQDVTICATGIMVAEALKAAEELAKQGVEAEVINVHTIKPLNKDIILNSVAKTKHVVTAEEHSVIGGLGSAVAELLSENMPLPLKRIGILDQFGVSGDPQKLREFFRLTASEIVVACHSLLQR